MIQLREMGKSCFYQRLGRTEVPKRGLANYRDARVDCDFGEPVNSGPQL